MSLSQLAIQYNTSKLTIKKKLLKIGISIRKNQSTLAHCPGPRTEIDENKFRELHSKGLSTRDLMGKFNITSDLVIKRIYKRLGLNLNSVNISDKLSEMYQITRGWDTFENLYELYVNQKKSINELSSICHADGDKTVRVALQKYGIPIRTQQEASKLSANKPEARAQRSLISKQLWQDEEFRERIISKLQGSHPQMPPEHSKHVSEAIKLLYKNNSYYEKHCEKIRKLWENPTPAMLENLYQTIEAMQNKSSEIYQKFNHEIHTKEHLDNQSQNTINQWSDLSFLKDKLPILRAKCSEAAKEAWKDPIYREKVMSSKTFISKLELIVRGILDDLNLKYRTICPKGVQFDICIEPEDLNKPKGILIEINGLYFHQDQKKEQDKFLFWKDNLADRYTYDIIWEYEFGARRSIWDRLQKILGQLVLTEVDLPNLNIREIDSISVENFYNKYHYLARSRHGSHIGAFFGNKLIAAASFSSVTRIESAIRLKTPQKEIRELSRFCISPLYHNPNLASFFLSRAINLFHKNHPQITTLLTFADSLMGHLGTIYKATNWIPDSQTNSSYFYMRNKYHYDKRTIYGYAKSVKMTENNFISVHGFEKIDTPPKYRFIYKF